MDYRAPAPDAPLIMVAGCVVALDRSTGRELWVYDLGRVVTRRFAIVENRLLLLDGEGILHCLDIPSGKLMGKVDVEMPEAKSMLIDGDRIYVTNEKVVAALDLNGVVLWKSPVPTPKEWSPDVGKSLPGLAVVGGSLVQPDFSRL